MTTATPDKPEIVPPDIHPATLEMLKATLPAIKSLNKAFPPGRPQLRNDAADELRQNFPALDDLTLAAFCAYYAMSSVAFAKSSGSFEHMHTAATFAVLAACFAWSLDVPEAPDPS
jgi:hypothetical protein